MDHGAPPVPRAPVHHCRRSPADAADRVPALSLRAPDAGVAGGQAIDGLRARQARRTHRRIEGQGWRKGGRSEEHTSELQSPCNLACRLLLEKKIYLPIAGFAGEAAYQAYMALARGL